MDILGTHTEHGHDVRTRAGYIALSLSCTDVTWAYPDALDHVRWPGAHALARPIDLARGAGIVTGEN